MSSEKPNFLSQPVVKNIFMYRNGDPYYEARRIVINQRRVCNFETLLHEVTSGIQAPFGAVRNIYTPRGGHKVDSLDSLQSGEQYVAAGRERFKKLDYLQICSRKKRMLQAFPLPVKPPPPNRIIVSARFLKPIKEPCSIFLVANGDVLNPAMRLLIHQRMLSQFDKVLELVTEKMGLRVLGGVRSLYTYEGQQVADGNQLESGQLYVAVGREKFKKLPYIDLLFTKPRRMRRYNGMKAYSLPPIYRMSKQNGTGKSMVQSSDSGDGDSKASPPAHNGNSKEHLSSIVREISQARLISLRKRRSGQNMSLDTPDNDDMVKTEKKSTEDDALENAPEVETSAADTDAANECSDGAADKNETTSKVDTSTSNGENKEASKTKNETMRADEQRENEQPSSEKENTTPDMVNREADEKGTGEKSKSEGQEPSDNTQDSNEKEDKWSKGEQDDQDQTVEGAEDSDSGKEVNSSKAGANDADTGEDQKEHKEHNNDPEKAKADNETKEDAKGKSRDANGEEDRTETKEATKKSGEVNGEVSGEDEAMSEAELKTEKKDSAKARENKEGDEKGE